MMSLPYKIGLAALVAAGVFGGGYMAGRQHGREATLKAAVAAYQMRETINHETDNLDPARLCLALGGVQHECAALMRGLDKTASGE